MGALAGKVAIVTGGSRGIGRAIALRLARDGATVAVNYGGNAEAASEVVRAIGAEGGSAAAFGADLSQVPEVRRLFAEVQARFRRLDVLVNNAGVAARTKLDELDEDTFDRLFALNAKGVLFACQEAARRMEAGGRIINISSSSTVFPMPASVVYAASKAVPKIYTEVLAAELGPRGITVNSVIPGPVVPGMFEGAPAAFKERATASSPFGRLGHPDDIAGVVAFLAGPDAGWITGQHILANGGATV